MSAASPSVKPLEKLDGTDALQRGKRGQTKIFIWSAWRFEEGEREVRRCSYWSGGVQSVVAFTLRGDITLPK
jgi:hypothetical protein